MTSLRTLVLDNAYQITGIFPFPGQQHNGCVIPANGPDGAFVKVYGGTAHSVLDYDVKIGTSTGHYYWPSIIALNGIYTKRRRRVVLSKDNVYLRDRGICQHCGKHVTRREMTYDHIIPRALGGDTSWENCCLFCTECNRAKGDKPPTGIWLPKKKFGKPTYDQIFAARREFPIRIPDERWIDYIQPWTGQIEVKHQ